MKAGSQRPLIGVTGPDTGGMAAWLATAFAVWRAGGRAVHITPAQPRPLQGLDALIIGGGADVAPKLYGQEDASDLEAAVNRSSTRWTRRLLTLVLLPVLWLLRVLLRSGYRIPGDAARDALEAALIDEADARGVPMLGICRGAQLINVHRGGTLYRDLADYYMASTQITTLLPSKPVVLETDSRLARIVGRTQMNVNSLHRHAVRAIGEQLRIAYRRARGQRRGSGDRRSAPHVRDRRAVASRVSSATPGATTPVCGAGACGPRGRKWRP